MRSNIFRNRSANKLWSLLLLLTFGVVMAREDKAFQEVSGTTNVALNKTVPSVKISLLGAEAAGASFQAINTTRIVTQPEGLIKLYYPLSLTRPTGEASITVTVNYLALINDKLEPKTTTGVLSLKLDGTSVKTVDLLRLPQAVKIVSTLITAASVPGTFVNIKLYQEVSAQVFDVLSIKTPQQINTAFVISHSDLLLPKNGTLDVTWSVVPGAESYELEWTYVSNQDPNGGSVPLAYNKIPVRDYLFRHNSSRVNT
ncbi:MAG TPA: hypothetical protein VL947_03030, partial [Cytophagales bacterium]|nr:hypothetical protein [Cytophagales bacterium]